MNIILAILAELLFITFLILGIYKLKPKFGLAPLYIFLGSIQFLQTVLVNSFYIKVWDKYTLSPGAIILFSASLFAVLLIYIKEGVKQTQTVIIGIIFSNLTFFLLSEISFIQSNSLKDYFVQTAGNLQLIKINLWVFLVGTIVLLLDALIIVIMYEFFYVKARWINMFFRLCLVLLIVLIFDAVFFTYFGFLNQQNLWNNISGQIIFKSITAVYFGTALYIYLKYLDKNTSSKISTKNTDIFSILTYQGKYESLLTEKQKSDEEYVQKLQEKNSELENSIYRLQILSTIKELPIDKSFNEQVEQYLKKVVSIFSVEAAVLRLVEKNKLVLKATVGIENIELPNKISLDEKHNKRIFFERITYVKNAQENEEEIIFKDEKNINYNYKTYIGIPLAKEKTKYGILGLYTHSSIKEFSALELEHLLIIGNQLTQIIQNAKLFETNEKQKDLLVKQIVNRKKIEQSLIDSELHLKTILLSEPECIKMVDKNGKLLDMNPAGLAMIEADNLEMVKGQNILPIINEPYQKQFNQLTKDVFKGKSGKLEFEITGLKGSKRWLESHAVPFKNDQGEIIALLAVTRDISDKKKAENELIKSEEKYRLLFKNNPLPVWIVNKENHFFLDINNAAIKLYGYSKEEFLNLKATEVRPKDEVEKYLNSMKDESSNIKTSGPWTHILKNGEIIKVEITAENIIYDDKLCRLIVVNNITEKLKTQELLENTSQQLRELASYLQNIREEERRDIAREIHDELGQQLTGLKMDVSWIKKKIQKETEQFDPKLTEILLLIDNTVKSVRRISTKLRPSILDDLGFKAALDWLLHDYEKRTRTTLHFTYNINEKELKNAHSIGLYRIVQESLNNIAKHANANNIYINFEKVQDKLVLTIRDDGSGFDKNQNKKEKSFGLLGIQERVIMMNGLYEINSEINKGTEIIVIIPLEI